MINLRFITSIIGRLLWLESVFMLPCVVLAAVQGDWRSAAGFVGAFLLTVAAGALMVRAVKVDDRVLSKRDGYFIVTFTWVAFTLFGALPYLLGGAIESPVDAIFETMSGFTTTGSTILDDVEAMPRAALLWRSLTQWLGGIGIIVLFIAILPGLGIEGRDLYVAEVTGPTHDKFSSTFTSTARHMWYLYIGLTALQCGLLLLGDVGWFDALCHSLTTMSSGGYSTRQASVATWNSSYVHGVFILFMLLSGTNFGLLNALFLGRPRRLFRDDEFRAYLLVILVASLIVAVGLWGAGLLSPDRAFRDALFQVVSILTSTGFTTSDYLAWPPLLAAIVFILFFIGGCAGSTSGGMKCVRVYLLFKNSIAEMKRIIHPHAVIVVKYNGKGIHPGVMASVMGFFVLFMIIFGVSSLLMAYFTSDIETACGTVLSAMSNTGPAFGDIGPLANHAALPSAAKLFLALLMLVGRLEIFTVLVLFSKAFWKK
ncbi:MAG: TrkH family potassium uptake protein [Odoribacteraceae bacterium]|jgi:trk system potassium uptake protein TrkH|nr:TrkH family potassium uptake protein [Odoribacteraceae bacterium]